MATVDQFLANHAGQTGSYVLETGAEALRARAWLVDHARESIDVQYFIWSTDNIGILAGEALLRAADRGVKVRVIVDDLLIDAAAQTMLALDWHPNVEIKIYNPRHQVGVSLFRRVLNMFADFRGFNQRMHDKTFIVDNKVAITGGRNMAAEYFDYSHKYNFRDRDILLLGQAPQEITASFERFWRHTLSVPVHEQFDGVGLLEDKVTISDADVQQHYRNLHKYAASTENFQPEVRQTIAGTPGEFERLTNDIVWGDVRFISDLPGKNKSTRYQLDGGGRTTEALARLMANARQEVLIQSPYLVMSDPALALIRQTLARGVKVRINTNSLAATDNLQAFSGYRNQREQLLEMGVEIFEFRPDARIEQQRMGKFKTASGHTPIFSLHAKTMIIDHSTVYIGTFNLDPRSENLNTEVGVILTEPTLAAQVRQAILTDMRSANSWNAATDNPDQYAGWMKWAKTLAFQWLPLRDIL
ncbi:MAG: phospholipase D-like domain-containing protein [Burkholderiaceae bacterium]